MLRKIIRIDEAACSGCGLCATACHEGAIGMVDGKARLLREDYCDGLGNCLPACPEGAITFEEREAPAYNAAAVSAARQKAAAVPLQPALKLQNWPVQLKLCPVNSPAFQDASLLLAADCTAYACSSFHSQFAAEHSVIIGCPKLDGVDYAVKLGAILQRNDIRDITLLRMEVPCCGGLEFSLRRALEESGKEVPVRIVVLDTGGEVLEDR